jgi:DtxR family Mn-dependent transcriptional regulator
MPNPGEHHPAFEEYCECIFELHEDDVDVIQARIAERLRVSRPSVSEMIKRIALTPRGEGLAVQVVRRHRLAERFLTDILGLSWALAHREAGKWEHIMSTEVEEAMERVLGNPTTCPHGNPIPGSGYEAPEAVRLNKIGEGSTFTVTRIPEELEFTPGMLDYLEKWHLVPGYSGTVTGIARDGSMTVSVEGNEVDVDPFATSRIFVTA